MKPFLNLSYGQTSFKFTKRLYIIQVEVFQILNVRVFSIFWFEAVYSILLSSLTTFFFGATTPSGLRPPQSQGF